MSDDTEKVRKAQAIVVRMAEFPVVLPGVSKLVDNHRNYGVVGALNKLNKAVVKFPLTILIAKDMEGATAGNDILPVENGRVIFVVIEVAAFEGFKIAAKLLPE